MDPRTEEDLRKLSSLDADAARALWGLVAASTGEERREAEELLDLVLFQRAGKDYAERVFLDPPPADLCAGSYRLGTVIYPPGRPYAAFGLREDEWIKHVLIVGMTGAGKTTLVYRILHEFAGHAKPFLVFDWKQSYRKLRKLAPFHSLRVYTVARSERPFRFNPLLPPAGVAPGEWLAKLVDVLKHAYFVGEGVEYLLREAITQVYEDAGFFQGRGTPTFYAVRAHVLSRRAQGRMSLWKASALRVVESLCFEHGLGPVLNTRARLDEDKLLSSPVILEVDALADADKVFLTEAVILWLYEHRKQKARREAFHHAL